MNKTKIRCTFAGHSEIHNSNLVEAIKTTAKELITEYGVNEFWVGHYGDFDHYAAKAIRELKQEYDIELVLVQEAAQRHMTPQKFLQLVQKDERERNALQNKAFQAKMINWLFDTLRENSKK